MDRGTTLLLLAGFLLSGLLVAAGNGFGYSDGISGSSGAIPQNLRKCAEIGEPGPEDDYCEVKMPMCGSCHGYKEDMEAQEGSKPSPVDRIKVVFKVQGLEDTTQLWEYTPGQSFRIDIELFDVLETRAPGTYAAGGFNLNASAGRLEKWTANDPNVRITGGEYTHQGSKNPDNRYCFPDPDDPSRPRCVRDGQGAVDDETDTAGEGTHTSAGSSVRKWSLKWTAPSTPSPPRGAALVMAAMLPDGDGYDDCTGVNGNCTQGPPYQPQSQWDWYRFMFPRRILCENGVYESRKACQDAVLAFILPPRPPLNTACEFNPDTCPQGTTPDGIIPVPPNLVYVGALMAAFALGRRRRAS